MTTPRVGINMKVEIQASLGSAKTITGITKANPGVVTTSGAHGYSTGDIVVHDIPQGMVELDDQSCRITAASGSSYTLEGVDTTNFSDFEADDGDSPPATSSLCTVKKVATFATYSNSTNISNPNVAPVKLDSTTLLDKKKKYVFGLPDSAEGNINTIFEPTNAAETIIKAATATNSPVVFRLTWAGGQKRIFNAYVSGGSGFDQQGNAIATGSCAFTVLDTPVDYAS
jgi:Phage tail tube protein, TTP